ncbi:MAG: site-2 protease family protein, partial [Chloroflexota bacterium]|nr:site-2 protease family protein [Chloroflexota bacterium]
MFGLPGWLLIVPVLGFLIFIHELGHFATAKWFGIKVTEFGFGFPPRIFGIRYRDTVYSLNWIPLGGFVRMVGEEDPSHPRSFARQARWKRAIVLVAGSVMNLAFPIAVFAILFTLPHDTIVGTVTISGVSPDSPAQEAGLRPGDQVLEVEGKRVENHFDLVQTIMGRPSRPMIVCTKSKWFST